MTKKRTDSDYPQPEAERRRDELLRNLLKTPPQPRPKKERGKSGDEDDSDTSR